MTVESLYYDLTSLLNVIPNAKLSPYPYARLTLPLPPSTSSLATSTHTRTARALTSASHQQLLSCLRQLLMSVKM